MAQFYHNSVLEVCLPESASQLRTKKRESPLQAPKQYLSICEAGRGQAGQVFFSVAKSAINAAKKGSKTTCTKVAKELTSQLVAIKIVDPDTNKSSSQEITVMQQILAHSQASQAKHHCAQLLEHGLVFGKGQACDWLSLKAYPSSLTLNGFHKAYQGMPVEFIFHIFMQLMETLHFLHEVCHPPIAHLDIHMGNIMLDTTCTQDFPGFPNLVLIDFGAAKISARKSCLATDRGRVYSVMNELCKLRRKFERDAGFGGSRDWKHPNGWEEFHEFVWKIDRMTFRRGEVLLSEMWTMFGEAATKARAATSKEILQELRELIETETQKNVETLEDALAEALRRKP